MRATIFRRIGQLIGRISLAARWAERLFTRALAVFADYQGTRLTEGIDTGQIAVPSVAERGGDFSQNPLTGSVNGTAWAAQLSALLGKQR